METLPDEMVVKICKRADNKTLTMLAKASQRLKNICSEIIDNRKISLKDDLSEVEYAQWVKYFPPDIRSEVNFDTLPDGKKFITQIETTESLANIDLISFILPELDLSDDSGGTYYNVRDHSRTASIESKDYPDLLWNLSIKGYIKTEEHKIKFI